MCEACLPTCGICKPMSVVMFVCEECEMPGNVSREEYLMYAGLPHRLTEGEAKMHEANAGSPLLCKECVCDLLEMLKKKVRPAPCRRTPNHLRLSLRLLHARPQSLKPLQDHGSPRPLPRSCHQLIGADSRPSFP